MVASAQRGPSGPTGGPLIGGVENREEILGNDHRKHVQKARERPATGSSVQASERGCEWEGATPFALIPRRGRIPLPLNPRIRAPHTIDIPRPDIKRNILGMPASSRHTANASIRVRPERPPQAASLASRACHFPTSSAPPGSSRTGVASRRNRTDRAPPVPPPLSVHLLELVVW